MQKNMDLPISAQRIIFSVRGLASLLNSKFCMLASKEPHQSEKVERQCYAVMNTGLEIRRP